VKHQDSLNKEGFRSQNPRVEDHSLREPICEYSPRAGLFQMVPNHWWYPHIGHRRRYRVLRVLSRKGIR